MKYNFKTILVKISNSFKYRLNRFYHEIFIFKSNNSEKVFTSIWKNNYWGNIESLSGPGSTLQQTYELRNNLPVIFSKFSIHSIFDSPCGDLNWMKHFLETSDIQYIGGDIVSDIIQNNKKCYSNEKIKFIKFDITSNDFPSVDLWLCRHLLFHLSNDDILKALTKFCESDIKYILTTSCITSSDHINTDIVTGDWRLLNLRLYPFNFPSESLFEINDYVSPAPPMTISMWTREQVNSKLSEIAHNLNR